MRCPYCNAQIDDDATFCVNCGNPIPVSFCTQCGAQLAPGSKFCPVCGANQNETTEDVQSTNSREAPYNVQGQPSEDYIEEPAQQGGSARRQWWILIIVIVAAAVAVILFSAWRFGLIGSGESGNGSSAQSASSEDASDHYLTIITTTLEFDEPGLTSRVYIDTDIESRSEITWTSADTAVAAVDEDGYVTSVGAGATTVTAQWETLVATCEVSCDFEGTATADTAASADTAAADTAGSEGDYLCSYSSDRLITSADLASISSGNYGTLPAGETLPQMIVNEIYAKHGYQFQNPDIEAYFQAKPWYQQIGSYQTDQSIVEQSFNSYEKQNVLFLKSVQ
ncbi:MAG: zinc-ribbon domain-containing protein [Lachnospiraceae bacterium]|nr:zinc-ribbon domain-containing protein [Lachnospiraceae bacterium]